MRRRRRPRSSPLRAVLFLAAALALAVYLWVRLPAPVARALLFVLASWAAAALLALLAFLIVSVDDLGEVVWAAVHGSAPAMWIAPAVLLLAYPGRVAECAALALIAVAACLLAGQRVPRRLTADAPAVSAAQPMFRLPPVRRGSLFSVVLGALALQAALALGYLEYRRAAAASLALTAVIWTRAWLSRSGARETTRPRPLLSGLGAIAFAILLTLGSTVVALDPPQPSEEEQLRSLLAQAHATFDSPVPATRAQQRGMLGVKGANGVILKQKAKPQPAWQRMIPSTPGIPLVLAEQLTFPFTGEYHLFLTSSGRIPNDAHIQDGTPLEALYVTTNGGTMETQAYQPLAPPVDFARCGQVHITIRSGEVFPVGATLQLFTEAGLEDLGTQVFGLNRNAEETLPYFVPAAPKRPPVRALRLVFRHDPTSGARSTKIAIVSFTLVLRGY
jgi:hypothetical protein